MASISEYQLKNGQKRYKIQVYGGLDPLTGKESRIIRKGFKRAKDAKLMTAFSFTPFGIKFYPIKRRN